MTIKSTEMTSSQKRKFFIGILLLFVFVGIIAGTLLVIVDGKSRYITSEIFNQRLVKNSMSRTIMEIFADSFIPAAAVLAFQMICGFFAGGQPLCLLTLFHRGAAGGISAALIYCEYGLKGFFIILVMLLPVFIFSMFILVLGARESIKLSNVIAMYVSGRTDMEHSGLKLYIIKFLVLTGFTLLCAILDSALTYIFTGLLLKP